MQKIKAASELYIETEKKKREKAYLGNVHRAQETGREGHQVHPRVSGTGTRACTEVVGAKWGTGWWMKGRCQEREEGGDFAF